MSPDVLVLLWWGSVKKFDKREGLYHLYLQPIRSANQLSKVLYCIKMRNMKVLKSGRSFKVLECQIILGQILRPFLISFKGLYPITKQADLSIIFRFTQYRVKFISIVYNFGSNNGKESMQNLIAIYRIKCDCEGFTNMSLVRALISTYTANSGMKITHKFRVVLV